MSNAVEPSSTRAVWLYSSPTQQAEPSVDELVSQTRRTIPFWDVEGRVLAARPRISYGFSPTTLLKRPARVPEGDWPNLLSWLSSTPEFGETHDSDLRIAAATTVDDIVSVLEQHGMARAARRIVALSELHESDPDAPEVDLESLRRLATAMISNPDLREPQLTLNDEGYMHGEWSTVENGRIAVTFLPSDLVDFAAISEPVKSGAEIKRVSGRHIGVEAINALRWFTARIAHR